MAVVHTGINNDTLKRRNRGLVLRLIATGECTSRVELAKRTGLSKMAVSNIIAEFTSRGVVEERVVRAVSGQGRNPIPLGLAPGGPRLVGLYLYHDRCVATLCDLRLQVLKEYRTGIDASGAEKLGELLCRAVSQVLPDPPEQALGIGVGSIGPVDLRRGMLLNPPNFFGIRDFAVTKLLEDRFSLPVFLDSQYNCAALAEKYFGVGRPYRDFIFLGIANGIGSGVISDGAVFRNASGLTSELGHVSIDWQGRKCACGGRGCLENYAGARVVERELCRLSGKALDFRGFCRLEEGGQAPELRPAFEMMVSALGCALTGAVNLFNPQAILIGHEGCYLPDVWLRELETRINSGKLVRGGGRVPVLRPALGPHAQVRSSACCLLSHVFDGEFL